jgi:amino acid adenylation domain-containing protein
MTEQTAQGFRLSPQQQRLWRLQSAEPGAPFRAQAVLRIDGDLDRPALSRALASVVERHEILRTAFPVPPGLTLPLQVIRTAAPPVLGNGTVPAGPDGQPDLAALLAAAAEAPFGLEQGDNLRASLIPLGPREHALVLTLPALCADPVALEVLGDEVARAYAAELGAPVADPEKGDEGPLQYADVAEWQNQLLESDDTAEGAERWRRFWAEHDVPGHLAARLPLEEIEPAAGPFIPAAVPVEIDTALAAAVAGLCREWGCPPAALFLAAWEIALWHGNGRHEVLVGVLQDGRRFEELRGALGLLSRYVPVHARLGGGERVRDVAARAAEAAEEAARWQEHFTWERAAGDGAPGATAGFPVCFDATPRPWSADLGGLARLTLDRRAGLVDRFQLELSCDLSGAAPRLAVRYDPRRFRCEAAEWIAGRVAAVLRQAAERPDAAVGDLDPVGPAERRHVLLAFNETPAPAEPGCLHLLFEAQADRTPERTALVFEGSFLTYSELDERANQLAHYLLELGAGPEVPVAVCLERSLDLVIAVLGVWKTGGYYVPLDPIQPADRIAFILTDTGAPLVLSSWDIAPTLPAGPHRVVQVDLEAGDIASRPASRPAHAETAGPESLAYAIYTSGSTGRPKGVLIQHRSPINLLAGLQATVYAGQPAPLAASLNAPLFFDASVQQLTLLLAGHTLHLVPENVRTDGMALLAFLRASGVEVFDCTPTQLRILLAAGLLAGPDGPNRFLIAGEAIDETTWGTLAGAADRAFFNIYGPTECTVDATSHRVGSRPGPPTIGRPLAGYEVVLLDPAARRPVPAGAPGELCVGGPGVARGYVGRPDLTAERFIPHPEPQSPGERLYRTGDLARHRADGELEFLGRIDHQIKVRGYRIEPGEIEAALAQHPYVREVVVVGRHDTPDHTLLVAYVVPSDEAPPALAGAHSELQRFLSDRLPPYMLPAAFVALPELPLTPNGKLDRQALPAPAADRPDLGTEHTAPRTPQEVALAAIWSQVLGVERLGIDDSFFALGGDSIRSLQVQSLAREQGLLFSVQELFQHQTIRELAAILPTVATEAAAVVVKVREPFALISDQDRLRLFERAVDAEDAYPLGMLQAGMVYHSEMSPESGIYQDVFSFTMRSRLDVAALEEAASRVAARHPLLRTSYDLAHFGEPLQIVHRAAHIPIGLEDLRHLSIDEQRRQIDEFLVGEPYRPFEWSRPPLVRIQIHLLSEERFQFTLTEHHSLLDGWSVASLLAELFNLYSKLATGTPPEAIESPPAPPNSFREFVAQERDALSSEPSRAFWLGKLGDGVRTRLPRWPSAPGATEPIRTRVLDLRVPQPVAERLRDISRSAAVPLKSVLLAAHLRVLGVLSGAPDVITGLSSDGRPEETGADRALGIFVSMLPLRVRLGGGTWLELIQDVFDAEREILPHRRFPLAESQRLLGGDPPFEAAFNFVHFHVYQEVERVEGVNVEGRRGVEVLDLPLTANFFVDPFSSHIGLGLNCHLNVLSDPQIAALSQYYLRTLEAIAADPAARYDAFSPLSEEERTWLVTDANLASPSVSDIDGEGPRQLVHQLFEAQADRRPDAVAVTCGGQSLTYAQLDAAANRLAHRLRALGVGPEVLVGVAVERSLDMMVALLGVLKAGGAYVPLDLAFPAERLAVMVEDSGLQVAIARRSAAPASLQGVPGMVWIDELPADGPEARPGVAVDGENPAYVIYTSGSTGRPKGVAVPHRALANFLESMRREPGLRPDDALVAVTSLSFDIAGLELYLPLTTGSRVVLASREEAADGALLADLVTSSGATVLQGTPSTWRLLLESSWPGDRRLRAFCGGEAVPPDLVDHLRTVTGEVWNLYGPTETTIWSTAADLTGSLGVTIGRPIANTRIFVVDSQENLTPLGVAGELRIGGLGLARGYYGRPDLTAERFVPDAFSGHRGEPGARLYRTGDLARHRPEGDLDCLGRLDFQVKVRGFRIELGEIEAALAAQPGIAQAVVVAGGDAHERRLVAYLVPEEGRTPDPNALRAALRDRLPEYMVPAVFMPLDHLPLTPNGKVDRRALPAPEPARPGWLQEFVAPRNPTEETLAALWSEVLRVERVGVHDNFLDLGGHSLTAIRLISRIRSAFEVDLPLRTLYDSHTVADLAVAVVKAQAERTEREELERMLAELEGISDDEAQSLLAHERQTETPGAGE